MPGDPWLLAFSPDGERLAGLTHRGDLRLWSVDRVLRDDTDAVTEPLVGILRIAEPHAWPFGAELRWSPTGERLVVAGRAGQTSLWTPAGVCAARWEGSRRRTDDTVAWSHGGEQQQLAEGETIEVRDGWNGAVLREIDCGAPVVTLALHPTEPVLATGHRDAAVALRSLETGELLRRVHCHDPWLPDPEDEVASIDWSPGGDRLALSIREGSHVFVLAAADLTIQWRSEYFGAHFGEQMLVRWSPDGRRLWFAFQCGKGPVGSLDPAADVPPIWIERARLPVFGGTAAVTLVRAEDGRSEDASARAVSADGGLGW